MDHDILVSGGGIAGLTAAAAFGRAGFSVLCVDPAPPVTERDATGSDLRTTAFLQPARDFLDRAGLWETFAPHATPLQVMRIVDAGGPEPEPRVTKSFDAADISDQPFGWNLPNWLLRRELVAALGRMDNVEFRAGTATASLFTRTASAKVGLSDGTKVQVRLVVAADGRASPMRQAAGIGVRTQRFGQKALAFAVTHPEPHGNVSTEIHRTGGPFTLVPLPDHEGRPSSGIVWMEDGREATRLMEIGTTEFEDAMTARSCGILGPLTLASRRSIWPIVAQEADRLTAERVALVAEAAHVMPPIGAQGLNMSLRDLDSLLTLTRDHQDDIGGRRMLDAYERARRPDIALRVGGIAMLNRMSQAEYPGMRDLRALGLEALYDLAPVRRTLMQLGLGTKAG
ncbi:2-octaprenyl-6-methoxyphenyl hydroxylase [Roseivivax halodurans JCM 10272]|uniref:2-octaprenyl-6-methoxyphenyl hydroxylase n=1 Tax=Roseivivax halodurans JCM 10272 TaxID=1449350 RepID=X7ED10_9RHOB|nr:UbiH/UbiF family hydroxylase [Roseivivax halodurans]ETX13091.1 2-octaprenyl-6-methoxyphenyl hydroxylase [Roseivivax halodurans JCM 10272]